MDPANLMTTAPVCRCGLLFLCGAVLLVGGPTRGTAQVSSPTILGSWHGTSTCVDKVAFPACKDEEVIYDVRAAGESGDSVALGADKVVNGAREFMGEFVLGRGAGGAWVGEIQAARSRLRLTVTVSGNGMSATLVELPSGRRARAMALKRLP